jgi:predicted MPP superfamily phosphohydrolase
MRKSSILAVILFIIIGCIELYFYKGIEVLLLPYVHSVKSFVLILYLCFLVPFIVVSMYSFQARATTKLKKYMLPLFVIQYLSKLFSSILLLVGDIHRGIKWLSCKYMHLSTPNGGACLSIPPSLSWVQLSMGAAVIPAATLGYGIIVGAHDYRVRRVKITLPNLPAAFHGIKIGQLSDIHSGSFFNKQAVAKGIDMLLYEKPDLIFFTGDLVNDTADELQDYGNLFKNIKAELGVFSTLGNHDYGDYINWRSLAAKQKNFNNLCEAHVAFGWQLLNNAHVCLQQSGEILAIIGVENWGKRFQQYGNLTHAYQGVAHAPVKLLLSHDPSHWDAEIRPCFQDIDVTFSGHTHGFQFGIEIGGFKWSPAQYLYKQWGGLYKENNQYLYVNRGFGYIGYPGRIGIWPEITIVELLKG